MTKEFTEAITKVFNFIQSRKGDTSWYEDDTVIYNDNMVRVDTDDKFYITGIGTTSAFQMLCAIITGEELDSSFSFYGIDAKVAADIQKDINTTPLFVTATYTYNDNGLFVEIGKEYVSVTYSGDNESLLKIGCSGDPAFARKIMASVFGNIK